MLTAKHILLTIDVEDWFQVENFKAYIPFETWDQRELRVERNVHRLLNLFDSCEVAGKPKRLQPSDPQQTTCNSQFTKHTKHTKKVRCTFFVLGWIADRRPNLVREIQSRGHEIASHGYHHKLPAQLAAADLKMDLIDSKKRLEDLIGSSVCGYRAPSFAISDPILKTIEDCGYRYDSSYNSFELHSRYGRISLNGSVKLGIARKVSDDFFELPISNLRINGRFFPLGGGAYFRLIPSPMFNLGVKSILKNEGAYLFYMHPWEIDPGQPRVDSASFSSKFRHYTNLNKVQVKLRNFIERFGHCEFVSCSQYFAEL